MIPDPKSPVEWDKSRHERVLNKLRIDHLNSEEKTSLKEICFDYQDVFFLPGDRLSCTSAVKHTIHLEPGTVPINTRPYRLPESQREEIHRQVTNLLEEGIIVEIPHGTVRYWWCPSELVRTDRKNGVLY